MRSLLALAGLNGLLAVGIGAFGAHAIADPQAKAWIATGALYGSAMPPRHSPSSTDRDPPHGR